MNLAKFSHKTMLVGVATLLALSLGASSSNLVTQPVQARTHRVHHHHYRRHSHRHAHHRCMHMSWRQRRKMHRIQARYRHYKRIMKRQRKEAAKYRWWAEHIYQDPKINFVNRPYKLHKNLWTQGYLDGTRDGNVSPLHEPCVNAHHIYSIHGKAGNYRLGWIAGYVNGTQAEGYVPTKHSLNTYVVAMGVYHNTAKAISEAGGAASANSRHGYYAAQQAKIGKYHMWTTHYEYRNGHLIRKHVSNRHSVRFMK